MKPENEKREFVRVPFSISTTVRTSDRTIWSSNTLDVSMNGLRVATTETVPPEGAFCEVEIVLAEAPEPVIIEARGSIVRSKPGTLAVHFTEVDVDSYEHLRQLILNNSEDPERAELEFGTHWGIRTARPPEKS
ncbi:MAG: PilZ domain-containing protein [Nitrospirota bacterium]